MNTPLAEALSAQIDAIVERNEKHLSQLQDNFYSTMPSEQRQAAGRAAAQAVVDDLAARAPIEAFYHEIALKRARNPEFGIESFKEAHLGLFTAVQETLAEISGSGSEPFNEAMRRLGDAMLRGAAAFYEAYTLEREAALREREAELEASAEEQEKLVNILRELSSPIVPVHDSILVLPLVGAIDTSRAQTITEDLLEAIVERQADLVIIDITGVPVVDTAIANYLLQTTKAVNLLGAQVILVGISAEVAQTIVGLDLDLNRLTVRANLQDGIDYALGQLGLQITEIHSLTRARA